MFNDGPGEPAGSLPPLPRTILGWTESPRFQRVSWWTLILTVFMTYWLTSCQYTGPAYLSDEIGYLSKAAAFAGYPVDMASSWHGGYSLFLAPLFAVFSDPFTIWQAAMVLNALLWAFSFMLLFYLLRSLFPERSFWIIFSAVAFCALYPAWITMSGYVFSTPAFVLVFLGSAALLAFFLQNDSLILIVPYSLLVGYLYWIHPTGLAVAASSFIVIGLVSRKYGCRSVLILHILLVAGMIAAYKFGVHDWLNRIMTPENYEAWSHYPAAAEILGSMTHPDFWTNWGVIFLGHCSYLVVSTLGIGAIPLYIIFWDYRKFNQHPDSAVQRDTLLILLLIFFSLFGILLLGSMSFALKTMDLQLDMDMWIYGRYSETVLPPLLGVGMIAAWRFRHALLSMLFVLSFGLFLAFFTNPANTNEFNNLVNIQAFWPQAVMPGGGFLMWFVLGAAGICLVFILNKRYFILLAAPLFLICMEKQIDWHNGILKNYSNPSGLVELIRTGFFEGACIGYTPEQQPQLKKQERRQLYSFYFYDYDFRRMSPEQWEKDCNGPYLTFSAKVIHKFENARVAAREKSTGLLVVLKDKAARDLLPIPPSLSSDLQRPARD